MRVFIFLSIVVMGVLASIPAFSQQAFYDVLIGGGNGIRFWQDNSYKIHMGNTAEYKYGVVTDYSIKMNMSNDPARGWTWGVAGAMPIASLNTQGHMQIAGNFLVNGNVGIGNTNPAHKLDVNGVINAAGILINGAPFAGGGSQWATSGSNISFAAGKVGIGTSNPLKNLHVDGGETGTHVMIGTTAITHRTSLWLDVEGTTGKASIQSWHHNVNQGSLSLNPSGGKVGIGINTPVATLDVYAGGDLGSAAGNFMLLNRFFSASGGSGNNFMNNTWLYRDGAGTDWRTARLHNGIQIDVSYGTPGVDTRTWWERSPFQDIQSFGTGSTAYLTIKGGNVGIGTTTPDAKLTVKGDIHTREVRVDLSGAVGPDYVFEGNYDLLSLSELETYIKQNKHLPEVPSAKEMEANGLNLKEMNLLLLKKVEELTLHIIELEKRVKQIEGK